MEWDNVSDTNTHAPETWMYPDRYSCSHNTPRVWAQRRRGRKYFAIVHNGVDRETIPLDVANIEEAKAAALMLFKMR